MGLYKEVDYLFAGYVAKQERIYNDACDVGIIVDDFTAQLCIELAAIFAGRGEQEYLLDGIKKHRYIGYWQDGTIQFSSVVVYLPWEPDGDRFRCTKWMITYNNDPVRKKQFISFTPSTAMRKEAEIWEEN